MKLFGDNIYLKMHNKYILNYLIDKFGYVIFDKKIKNKIILNEDSICNYNYLNLYDKENIYVNEENFVFEKILSSYLYFDKKENRCYFHISPNWIDKTERLFANRLFYIISYWLSINNILSLHGGAFYYKKFPNEPILIFGESGYGKTSIILDAIIDGGKMACEENLFIETQESPMVVIVNKQDISLRSDEISKKYVKLSKFITENKLANNGKVRVGLRNMNSNVYSNEMFTSKIIILNSEKRKEASLKPIDKLSAIKKLIYFHKIYESYGMTNIVQLICKLIDSHDIYELVPSVDIKKTKEAIHYILKGEELL